MRAQVRCDVRDLGLATAGEELVGRAAGEMPVLRLVRERFERERPLAGLRVSACMPVSPQSANLVVTLQAGGAELVLCAADPHATDDAVAAALVVRHGIRTYAIRGEEGHTHHAHLATALAHRPDFTVEEGAALVTELHRAGGRLMERVLGGTEGTLRGAVLLEAMAAQGALRYPVVAVGETGADLSAASHALSLEYMAAGRPRLGRGVHTPPVEVDREGSPLRAVGESA